jgi:hypothetical protein
MFNEGIDSLGSRFKELPRIPDPSFPYCICLAIRCGVQKSKHRHRTGIAVDRIGLVVWILAFFPMNISIASGTEDDF